ncbi:hypothetical protein ACPOL_6295 [Acidisarcina polymorpha]|uniref:Lysozyme inhibitor LprI-like N-terminal domain-containing protein n=1 Tax=Acidisarcina polymorpha TaxID=2211140 RepID=A0A2Z5G8T0_9BACT|nr:lysozyme inhibitor LprI family protein [Acidisarcina polymorpha]AXC15531.1 hypothetical protein ACPOL_6295 [Acidisarcina polymorpha]
MKSILIGVCALLTCAGALAQGPSDFSETDAKLKACVARDSSNMHVMACNSVAQIFADARLNSVYQAWAEALKHPKPDEARDDAEILKRLVTAERAWIAFRDTDCSLQSTSMLGGTGEPNAYGDCVYAMTKTRVKALEAVRNAR